MSIISNQTLSTVSASYSVSFSCSFENHWTSENHPDRFPTRSAHFTSPVIAAHHEKYTMWEPDGFASDGVRDVAEFGDVSELSWELFEAQEEGTVGEYISGRDQYGGVQVFDDIALTPWFPYMSSVTMVAPSPDWFTGFYNVKPVDETSMVWYESFVVAAYPWDSGTRGGTNFQLGGPRENRPIFQYTTDNLPNRFYNEEEQSVLPLGFFTCSLVTDASLCSDNKDLIYNKRVTRMMDRDCTWMAAPKNQKRRDTRCNRKHLGTKMYTWCPESCGECASPTTSPSASPTESSTEMM